MLDVSEYFIHKASRQFGDRGSKWVAQLPALIAACEKRWRLHDWQLTDELSINLVCFARSDEHGDVVVKIQGPHDERLTELTALRLFDGGLVCRCLDSDADLAAILLERIMPGDTLRSLHSKTQQLDIGTTILANLPIPLTESHGLPSYQEWLTKAFRTMRQDYSPDARFTRLMDAGRDLFHDVDNGEQYLLHGDLHHDNILSAGNGQWKAIDPQGVIGSRVFESGRFIQNHHTGPPLASEGEDRLTDEDLLRTIGFIARSLKYPTRNVAAALFILHLLSTCWGYEMGYTQDRLDRCAAECSYLLSMLESL